MMETNINDRVPEAEEETQRIDQLCRNVIDGSININHLMIRDRVDVMLRMQEVAKERTQNLQCLEQKILALNKKERNFEAERNALLKDIVEFFWTYIL
ncbi:MAG: hypothetical protein ACI3WQ_11830 [Faecousia sp.]